MTQQRVSPISVTSVLPAVPVLSLQAALGQSANLTEWRNSSGTTIAFVRSDGYFRLDQGFQTGTMYSRTGKWTVDAGNSFLIIGADAALQPLIVRGAASQTANLQEWQNSAGTIIARVGSSGFIVANDGITTGSISFVGVSYNGLSNPSGVTNLPTLVVNGIGSQTGDLQQWRNSAGAVLCRIDSAGRSIFDSLGVQGSPSGIAYAYFGNAATTTKNVVVRAIASQTANLQEWQDSSGTVLASLAASGAFNNLGSGTMATFTSSTDNARIVYTRGLSFGLRIGSSATAGAVIEGVDAAGGSSSYQPIYIGGSTVALHTGNTTRLTINAVGEIGIGTAASAARQLFISGNVTGATTGRTVTVTPVIQSDVTSEFVSYRSNPATQAATFTLANLVHFNAVQGTFGTNSVVTNQIGYYIDASLTGGTNNYGIYGAIASASNRWNVYIAGTAANYFAGQTTIGSTSLTLGSSSAAQQFGVVAGAATTVGAVIRGAASQTANLQEWQNSAGTVLGYVGSAGAARFEIVQAANADVDLRSTSGGGVATFYKATSAPSYFGTGYARLYFRDGTNAGTLKLVVRAGTAGAETTILDNIPQT